MKKLTQRQIIRYTRSGTLVEKQKELDIANEVELKVQKEMKKITMKECYDMKKITDYQRIVGVHTIDEIRYYIAYNRVIKTM